MYSKIFKKTIIRKKNTFVQQGIKLDTNTNTQGKNTIMASAIVLLNYQDISKGLNILHIYIYNLIW